MRLPIDSHVPLRAAFEPTPLTRRPADALREPRNRVYLSWVPVRDLPLKQTISELSLPRDPEIAAEHMGFELLPVTLAHVRRARSLPLVHRDPPDRVLAAQADVAGMRLVTVDAALRAYPLDVLP